MFFCRIFVISIVLSVSVSASFSKDFTVNGHARGQAYLSIFPENDLLSKIENAHYFLDGSLDFRLNGNVFLSDMVIFDFAYEAAVSGGQLRNTISKLSSVGSLSGLYGYTEPNDDSQLFSLTKVFSKDEDHIGYHRIDRLSLTVDSRYGTLKGGRQAITWGNGMVFNPADVVNPFAPGDIIRDYKEGADMLLYQIGGMTVSDFQLVYVPRRNSADSVDWDESTLGSKIKISYDEKDFDLLVSKNYGDYLIGTGLTGYLGGAVYRTDVTLTFLQSEGDVKQYLSAVANMDYSWEWNDQNWYGMIEVYYNGLGHDTIWTAFQDEDLVARLKRGEMFVTGKWYLDAMVQYEIHPLVNSFVSFIYNLEDQSLLIQPRIVWDYSQSSQLLAGVDMPIGNSGDEFGKYIDNESGNQSSRGTKIYIVLTWFF